METMRGVFLQRFIREQQEAAWARCYAWFSVPLSRVIYGLACFLAIRLGFWGEFVTTQFVFR